MQGRCNCNSCRNQRLAVVICTTVYRNVSSGNLGILLRQLLNSMNTKQNFMSRSALHFQDLHFKALQSRAANIWGKSNTKACLKWRGALYSRTTSVIRRKMMTLLWTKFAVMRRINVVRVEVD